MSSAFESFDDYKHYFLSLIERERKAEKEFHLNEIRHLTGKQRQSRGRALLNCKGKLLGRFLDFLVYRFSFAEAKDHQIKVGDIVLVSKGEPLKAALEATVSATSRHYIEVMTKERLFKSKLYRIDLFVSDITFKRMKQAIENIENSEFDPEIILGKRQPEVVHSNEESDKLNESQNEALRFALNSELFLIHGPPGTGKTTTLAEVVRKNIGKGRILVSADSNVAIDNMLEKLKDRRVVRIGHPAKIDDELLGFSIDTLIREDPRYLEVQRMIDRIDEFKRVRDKNYQKPTPSQRRGLTNDEILTLAAQDRGKRGLKSSKIKKMAGWIELNNKIVMLHEQKEAILKKIVYEKLKDAEVIFTTNSGAGSEFLEDFKFDMLFLDEAAQCIEPSALIPMVKSRRVVMAGDHKQLPPTILSDAKRLSYTLFERFENLFNASYTLRIQYRMNDKICKFSSCEFYDCLVRSHESVKDIKLSDIADINGFVGYDTPIVFFDTRGRFLEANKKGSYSKYNPLEAEFVKRLVDELLSLGVKHEDIGVITPYKDHEEYMKRMIDSIEIKSIDGFQGREKEVIILSLVRANDNEEIGFLRDKRRLNVAITRAKRKLIIVGDARTLTSQRIYAKLIDYIAQEGDFREITPDLI
ncbi:IGHMBP2 family helicase [Hippea sp. KM1]|uniref:IGHMBP2 family helicase n=1 Tax=Hippea sp. KM1 TaxID=944481 RepID=UPI00046D1396|nr:IGHMBP2 family helicase [Hippea sp. KM1]